MRALRRTYTRFLPCILAVYILAVAGAILYFNTRLTVETVAVILLVAAILSGRGLLFLHDWGVFIAILLAWQVASTVATAFAFPYHLHELIDADKLMFGGIVPPVWLQQHLYHPGRLEPWDVLAAIVYMLHFLVPMLAGFLIWRANRELFRKFALSFVFVAVAGFITYILYPSVPPWMAGQPLVQIGRQYVFPWEATSHFHGSLREAWAHAHVYLPGVKNLFNVFAGQWYNPYHGSISAVRFLHLHYDAVGAIPSEHAAYPLLFFLFLRRQFGRWGYLALPYLAVLLFSITYLGQHYVIDAVIGFAYAIVGYLLIMYLVPWAVARVRSASDPRVPRAPARAVELEEA